MNELKEKLKAILKQVQDLEYDNVHIESEMIEVENSIETVIDLIA